MTNPRAHFMLVALVLWAPLRTDANALKVSMSSTSIKQQVLSLDFTNNGQHVKAAVGQQIEITLGTVGPAQYGVPQVSSTAVRLESTALNGPPNPGGLTFVYIFEAAAAGEAQVTIPILHSPEPDFAGKNTFVTMIRVGPAHGKPRAVGKPDQANTATWTKAWTNLLNDAEQTFVPSLPRLTSVEVGLVVGNLGPPDEDLSLSLINPEGEVFAVILKTVPVEDCGQVRFLFPNGGAQVSPGLVYSIRLNGGSLFGWKYVAGGYKNGEALFNGKPLLQDVHSSFLFRTFGAN